MKASPRAILMIKHHEGVRYKPYRCPAALWTVGVGHLLYPAQSTLKSPDRLSYPLKPADARVWSSEEVDALLAADLVRFERGVARYCPAAVGNQGHFDALVSFSFNLGLGTLQRSSIRSCYNRGEYENAADGFLKYTRGGGKILPGLVKRRNDEIAVFKAGS
jgi:lysozyme